MGSSKSKPKVDSETTANITDKQGKAALTADQKSPRRWADDERPVPKPHLEEAHAEGVFVFCLTGGPGGGKTTAIAQVADRFRSLGFQVLIIPEVATMLHASGLVYPSQHHVAMNWEASRLRIQLSIENNYMVTANSSKKPTVIICDRGTVDTKAYISAEAWDSMLQANGWDLVTLRDQRYDAVVHLVTAADGAEEFYTTANNEARRESPEQARAMDMKTRNAWVGHSRFRIVGNEGTFKKKLNQVVAFLMSTLGLPNADTEGRNMRRKFVVSVKLDEMKGVEVVDTTLTSTFLFRDNGDEVVIRKRSVGEDAFFSVSQCMQAPGSDESDSAAHRRVVQRVIDEDTYGTLLKEADHKFQSVIRKRRCFVWQRHYFELDTMPEDDGASKKLLIVEADENAEIEFPPWVTVEKDVSLKSSTLLRELASGQRLSDL